MRSRSTTTCRSSGLARLGLAAAGLALAGLAGPVTGQSSSFTSWPPLKWEAHESLDSHQDAHDYDYYWDQMRAGPYIGGVSNEGRGIAVAVVDPGLPVERSIFVVGVSTESGEGRQFTTWRYREEH